MQSSSTVTLRAMVMLVCLIAVPLVAVSGTSLPKLLTDAVQGRRPSSSEKAAPRESDVAKRGGEAPPFSPSVRLPEHDVATAADPHTGQISSNRGTAAMQSPPGGAQRQAPTPLNRAAPAPHVPGVEAAPLWGPPGPQSNTAPKSDTAPQRGQAVLSGSVPGRGPPDRAAVNPAAAKHPGAPTTDRGEPFAEIQHRLRDLGASYYLLETCGASGDQFRFHCKVPASADPRASQAFEAIDRDPIAAMRKVLAQVEGRRVAR